jgi:putative acetyltransferase
LLTSQSSTSEKASFHGGFFAFGDREMTTFEPYVVRGLMPEDVPALVKIIDAARREFGVDRRVPEVLERSDLDLFGTYQRPRADYFVALQGAVPVGGAGIAPLSGADEQTCELQRMYLSLPHRGHGIGKMLLDQCIRRAKALQFRRCYAETVSEMRGAIRFYEANGFQRLAASVGSSGHSHNDYWLMLDLASRRQE